MKTDTSIFETTKEEILQLLSTYEKKELKAHSNKTDLNGNKIVDTVILYIIDREAVQKLKEYDTLLTMEYAEYDKLNTQTSTGKKRGRKVVDKYSIDNIVKVINFDAPANAYKAFISTSWEQVNDREKVFERLETDFIKHKNKLKANTRRKLKEKGLSQEIIADINNKMDKEIEEALENKKYLIENFDNLDVKISSYYERVEYAALYWYVDKKRQKDVNLRKQVVNALWVEELPVEKKIRDNNELIHFLKGAKRAYGNIFYKPLDSTGGNNE